VTTTKWAEAADEYGGAGWEVVLPIPAGTKGPPPRGYTGANGRTPSLADRTDWELYTPDDANIALVMPANVIGIDVDQYGQKAGADNLAAYREEHGLPELPATWRSTSRPAPSGIRLYRVPEGVRLRGVVVPDVEVIQHHHRYALVWPSRHPTTGHPYRWLTPAGAFADGPPEIDDLPELQAEWLDALQRDEIEYGDADYPPAAEHREADWSAKVVHHSTRPSPAS
jgi:hypothetical protein